MRLVALAQRLIEAITVSFVAHPTMDQELVQQIKVLRATMSQGGVTGQEASLRPLLAQLILAVESLDDVRIRTCVQQVHALLYEPPSDQETSGHVSQEASEAIKQGTHLFETHTPLQGDLDDSHPHCL